jgi:hypothetical protein
MPSRRRSRVVHYFSLATIALGGASSVGCLAETSYEIDTRNPDHVAFTDRDGRELLRPGIAQDDLDFHRDVVLEHEPHAVVARCDACSDTESVVLADHRVTVDEVSLPGRPADPHFLGDMTNRAGTNDVEGYLFFSPPGRRARTSAVKMRVELPWSDVVSVREKSHHSTFMGTFFLVASSAALGFLALEAHDSLTSPPGERGVDIPLAVGFGAFAFTTAGVGIYELAAPDSEKTIYATP